MIDFSESLQNIKGQVQPIILPYLGTFEFTTEPGKLHNEVITLPHPIYKMPYPFPDCDFIGNIATIRFLPSSLTKYTSRQVKTRVKRDAAVEMNVLLQVFNWDDFVSGELIDTVAHSFRNIVMSKIVPEQPNYQSEDNRSMAQKANRFNVVLKYHCK